MEPKVITIAEKTRKWAEKIYRQYPTSFDSNLCGLCLIASVKLMKNLRRNNIEAELGYNPWHAFVIVKDKIVDITATQFSPIQDKVYIDDPVKLLKQSTMWEIKHRSSDLDIIRDHLDKTWDVYQNPWKFPAYAKQKNLGKKTRRKSI